MISIPKVAVVVTVAYLPTVLQEYTAKKKKKKNVQV